MKQLFAIFLILSFVAICAVGAYAYFVYVPAKVEQTIISSFNRFGFENPTFGTLIHKNNRIIMTDIALDQEQFSTIDELEIHFSLLKFLTASHHGQDIIVRKLKLTGELSDNLFPIIVGWKDNAQFVKNLQSFPARKITIESASLDLFSDMFGGVKFRGDGQILIHKSGEVSVKARVMSKQNRLGFSSKLEATLSENESIDFKTDFENLSVNLQHINIKRGNGTIEGTYSKSSTTPFLFNGTAQISSLQWYNLPLSNVLVKTEFNNTKQHYELEGKTFGPEGIMWRSNIIRTSTINTESADKKNTQHSKIYITPNSLYDLQNFLGRNKKLSVNAYIPKMFLDMRSPNIVIENTLSNPEKNIEGSFEIKFEKPTVLLKGEYHNIPEDPDNLIGSIKIDKTTFCPKPETTDKTRFDLATLGNFTLRDYASSPIFLWIAHTTIQDGIIDFGSIEIPDIHGVVFLGGNHSDQKDKIHTLDFTFPLKNNIKQNGVISISLNDAKTPLLGKLSLEIYDGKIETQTSFIQDGEIHRQNVLNVSDINLAKLTRDANLAGISINGALAGIIPFAIKDNGVQVTGGLLQSQDEGVIHLPETVVVGLFPDSSSEDIILRQALQNFHYEFFEVRFDGDLNDRIMVTISARGTNPDIKHKKPVDVNLQIETPISLLFKALTQKQ
ncbi:MAG: YdbH domain-containing protein [Alphaproteobacteria bacterium]|nr:YdbH domain-containing protein [Alphaproteobacteria bacterium]